MGYRTNITLVLTADGYNQFKKYLAKNVFDSVVKYAVYVEDDLISHESFLDFMNNAEKVEEDSCVCFYWEQVDLNFFNGEHQYIWHILTTLFKKDYLIVWIGDDPFDLSSEGDFIYNPFDVAKVNTIIDDDYTEVDLLKVFKFKFKHFISSTIDKIKDIK